VGRNDARLASAMKIYGPGRLCRVGRICGGVQALGHSPASRITRAQPDAIFSRPTTSSQRP
jgi:hypothetical protein